MDKKISTPIAIIIIVVLAVLAGGIIIWRYSEMSKGEIVSVEKVVSADETVDWKTYRNEEYGYEIKYPSDGNFVELSSTGFEGPDKGYIVDFTIKDLIIRVTAWRNMDNYKNIDGLIEGETVKHEKEIFSVVPLIPGYTEERVGGKPALKWLTHLRSGKRIGAMTLVFNGGGYFYFISTGDQYASEFTAEKEKIYDLFLSTFRFLE